jgi:hypothetical protein
VSGEANGMPSSAILIPYSRCKLLSVSEKNRNLLRSESLPVLSREKETKDHVTEIGRVVIQRRQPVLETYRIGIAPQVSKVLHRYKRAVEEAVADVIPLDYFAQYLPAVLLSTI